MGRKAVNLLIHTMLIIFTLITVAVTAMAIMGEKTNPSENGFMALMALVLPGLLMTNLALVIYWICRRRWWFLLPALALGANYEYYPRVFQWPSRELPQAQADAVTLKVATYNVNYFSYDERLENTVSFIAGFLAENDVDVICFQEFASKKEFTPDSIASALRMPYFAMGKNSVGYRDLAIFSRYPIENAHMMIFQGSANSAMWGDLNVDGQKVRLMNAHLQTTSVNWEKDDLQRQLALGTTEDQARAAIRISNIMKTNFRRRASQAAHITAVMDTTRMPLIYCGDTNDTPSSFVYSTLVGEGKRIDGFTQAGRGYAYTFHSMKKLLRIDYILYTPQLRGLDYYSPYCRWSDHNPVVMELTL